MRVPTEAQLSPEQREICFAPANGTVLVVGPPGSGKTVVAHFRAERLRRRGEPAELLMFNHVLKRYTGNAETFYRWTGDWWRSATGQRFPQLVLRDDEGGVQRAWDFKAALERVKGGLAEKIRDRGHWGHVILDEAQDFDRDAHRLLFVVQNVVFAKGTARPSMMILADENQRINENNSTVADIRQAHMVESRDLYTLEKNYRNTREIALFAREFYVGLSSGIPALPEARGEKPLVIETDDLNAAVDRVAEYARLNSQQEIGVLVKYDPTRKKFFNKLRFRLQNDAVDVQTYSYRKSDRAEDLEFDRGGVVTVLCYASSKGLEFDAVFLPELQTLDVDSVQRDVARMEFYVMTSRARSRLFLMISDPGREASIWRFLPLDDSLVDWEST